ncbi:MAG: hypothetical protein ACJ8C4_07235 [Gemmataceae bacterium]
MPILAVVSDDQGGQVVYDTNELGRLNDAYLYDGTAIVASAIMHYTAQGWLDTVTLNDADGLSSIVSTYDHDAAGKLTSIKHESIGSSTITLSEFDYTYDDAGRITQYTGPEGTRDYTYDKTDQMLTVTAPSGPTTLESFSYDANGNRDMSGYSTVTGNRLHSDGTSITPTTTRATL